MLVLVYVLDKETICLGKDTILFNVRIGLMNNRSSGFQVLITSLKCFINIFKTLNSLMIF